MRSERTGLSLAESLLAAVLLALAVMAISMSLAAGHMQSHHAAQTGRAMRLAEELMEIILALPYYDPQGVSLEGPEAGESGRKGFDNIDDFHGYVEPAGAVTDMAGNPYPAEYRMFRREVTTRYEKRAVSDLCCTVPGLVVTVTVRDQKGRTWQLSRFIAQPID